MIYDSRKNLPPQTLFNLSTLHPFLVERAAAFISFMRLVGIPLIVTQGSRTLEQQEALFAQGRTTPGPIVTKTLNSKHLSGGAFDIAIEGASTDTVPTFIWEIIGYFGKRFGFKWGGDWEGLKDYLHFEL